MKRTLFAVVAALAFSACVHRVPDDTLEGGGAGIGGSGVAGQVARAVEAQDFVSPPTFWMVMNAKCGGAGTLDAQTLTSTGTSASLTNLTSGDVYSMSCDAAVNWAQLSTVTNSYSATPTTFGEALASKPDKVRWVQKGASLSVISVTGTSNCQVLRCHAP